MDIAKLRDAVLKAADAAAAPAAQIMTMMRDADRREMATLQNAGRSVAASAAGLYQAAADLKVMLPAEEAPATGPRNPKPPAS